MTLSREFAELLRAGRHDFNARVSEARHRYPAFSTELFSHFLAHCVDPLVIAVDSERRGSITSAAFDVALELVGRELCGGHARGLLLETLWREVFPALASCLPAQPAPVFSAFGNALLNLQAQSARPEQWLQLLRELGPNSTPQALLELGLLAAWRAGAAQFRRAALRVAARQPEATRTILGLAKDQALEATLHLLENDPWLLSPSTTWAPHEIGAFTGFGGLFTTPPQLRACAEGFMVASGDRHFLLLADSFGQVLLPASAEEYLAAADYQATATQSPVLHDGSLHSPRGQADLDFCHDDLQLVWNDHSAALFSPYSFSILVMPWR